MSTFQERFTEAFNAEAERRLNCGEPKLTKTMVWKAANATSGAFSQWYNGSTGAKLSTCFLLAKILKVDPHWLFDGSVKKSVGKNEIAVKLKPKSPREKLLDELAERASRINEIGIAMLIGEAKAYESSHPVAVKETVKFSQ